MIPDFSVDFFKSRRFAYFGPRVAALVDFSIETTTIVDDGERSYRAFVVSSIDHDDGTMTLELAQDGFPLRERINGALSVVRLAGPHGRREAAE